VEGDLPEEVVRREELEVSTEVAVLRDDVVLVLRHVLVVTREDDECVRVRERPAEPTPSALDLACVFDLDAPSARLQPLLDAQERFDSRVHGEPIAPANLPEGFAEAIDQLC